MTDDAEVIYFQDHFFALVGDKERVQFVRTHNGTTCVPLTDSGMVIFVVEPSPAFGQDVLMLPGGKLDPGETLDECANRELQEEIGYKSLRMNYLGELHPWQKYLTLCAHIYLARDLVPSKLHGDEIYTISTYLAPLHDFERMIADGRLRDSTVIAALYMARHFLEQEEAAGAGANGVTATEV